MDVERETAPLAHTIESLLRAIEQKDRYTAGHTRRVMHYAAEIAREMGVAGASLAQVRLGAAVHDVGKLGVPDAILRKPAALDEAELLVMGRHPEFGSHILAGLTLGAPSFADEVVAAARFHHERWDGQGYPEGRRGREIPRVARIVAVADAFDAMTSHRPYRRAIGRARAYQEIVSKRATQFCPEVVDAFARAYVRGFRVESGVTSGHHQEHALVR